MFAKATDERLTSLVKAIDKFVADNKSKRMAGFVVLLDENNDANKQKLTDVAKANDLSVPLTIAPEGAKGPSAYKINADVPITVLVASRNKVKANFVLTGTEAKKDEAEPILAAAKEMLSQ